MAGLHLNSNFLSVVIPAFNEEHVIGETVKKIVGILDLSSIDYEIVVVNDGSMDQTLAVLRKIKPKYGIRIIDFCENVGHMCAIRAGLEASIGNYVATIDADLQDPPEYLPEMFSKLLKSKDSILNRYDVVQAFRQDRTQDTRFKRISADLYYKLVRKLTGISVIPHAADFRIMNRAVVDKLLLLPEKKLVLRLVIPSLGFKILPFPIVRAARFAGKTKYTISKMFSLAIDSIISFTYKPLRILALFGFLTSGFLLCGAIAALCLSYFGSTVPGWTSLILLILSTNALLIAILGLLGEYVGRIYELAQARPRPVWTEIEN